MNGSGQEFKYSRSVELYRLVTELDQCLSAPGSTRSYGLEAAFDCVGNDAGGRTNAVAETGAAAGTNAESEPRRDAVVTAVRSRIRIDTDWLDAVETGLPHLEKAIEQGRSLIKKDGEVVRIDRAKHFSRESVSHLARHSNLIKSLGDDGKVQPEEIYMTENDEDFGIYENRFLYLALTDLTAFTALREAELKKASANCGIRLRLELYGDNKDSRAVYTLELTEQSKHSDAAADSAYFSALERIGSITLALETLARNPLMQQVAQLPKLLPPVIRTNIIKSNTNFDEVFRLYTYINSFSGTGLTVEREESGTVGLDARELGMLRALAGLQLFTGYTAAFDGWDELKARFDAEDNARRQHELAALKARLHRLRAQYGVADDGTDNGVSDGADNGSDHANNTTGSDRTNGENNANRGYTRALERETGVLLAKLEDALAERIGLMAKADSHRQTSDALKAENIRLAALLEQLKTDASRNAADDLRQLRGEYEDRLASERSAHLAELDAAQRAWEQERALLKGRLRAAGIKAGDPEALADIDNREDFIALEAEKQALDDYFKAQWKQNRRLIRRRVREELAQPAADTDKDTDTDTAGEEDGRQ